jgi:hypothetical protein
MLRSIVSVRALVNLNLRYAISKRSVHNAKEKLQEYPEKLLKIKHRPKQGMRRRVLGAGALLHRRGALHAERLLRDSKEVSTQRKRKICRNIPISY